MVKKLFVLTGISFLTGFVATAIVTGCSSDPEGASTPDAATNPEAATPVKTPPPEDGGADAPPSTCPSTDPIAESDVQAIFKWAPPQGVQAACSQQNIDDLKALFAKGGGSAKYTDIKTSLGATCAACTFAKTDAPNWQVILEVDGGFVNNESGSCFAQLDSTACGKAAFEYETCLKLACPASDCGDQTAVSACNTKAGKGACKALSAAVGTACPKLQSDVEACGNIYLSIVASCAGGADAGIDAASP